MSENTKLKNDSSAGENKLSLEIKIKVFFYCIRETLIARIFFHYHILYLYIFRILTIKFFHFLLL